MTMNNKQTQQLFQYTSHKLSECKAVLQGAKQGSIKLSLAYGLRKPSASRNVDQTAGKGVGGLHVAKSTSDCEVKTSSLSELTSTFTFRQDQILNSVATI
jgi:hypothetical protein